MELSKDDIKKISEYIANYISISSSDLCFCGSTNIYSECCEKIPRYWLTQKYLDELIGFSKSKKFEIKNIPISFFTKLESRFQNTFDKCACPGCPNKCIGSHIFGGSQMKNTFKNNVCSWYAIDDSNKRVLKSVGITDELKYKVFCESCDNKIFRVIDETQHDTDNISNQLLHTFRALAYQYQFARTQLGIAHQFIFAQIPISFSRNNFKSIVSTSEKIEIKHFVDSYQRYKFQYYELDKLWSYINDKKKENIFYLGTRLFESKQLVFAQGIENPKFDIMNNKIIFENHAAIIYTLIPVYGSIKTIVIIATSNKEYYKLIEQFKTSNDYRAKKYILKLLKKINTPRSIFLPVEQRTLNIF